MFDIGGQELILILLAILIFFGPKKLPELAQSFGRGLREFRKAQREFTDHINSAFEEEQRKSTTIPRPGNAVPRQVSAPPPPPPTPGIEPNRETEPVAGASQEPTSIAEESPVSASNGGPVGDHVEAEGTSISGESRSSDQT